MFRSVRRPFSHKTARSTEIQSSSPLGRQFGNFRRHGFSESVAAFGLQQPVTRGPACRKADNRGGSKQSNEPAAEDRAATRSARRSFEAETEIQLCNHNPCSDTRSIAGTTTWASRSSGHLLGPNHVREFYPQHPRGASRNKDNGQNSTRRKVSGPTGSNSRHWKKPCLRSNR